MRSPSRKNDLVKPYIHRVNDKIVALKKSLRGAPHDNTAPARQGELAWLGAQATLLHALQAERRGRRHPGVPAKITDVMKWLSGRYLRLDDGVLLSDLIKAVVAEPPWEPRATAPAA